MLLGQRYKFKLYRRLEVDIFGKIHQFFVYTRLGRYLIMLVKEKLEHVRFRERKQRFVYRIDIINPRREYKKKSAAFVKLIRLKLFYLFLTHRQIRRLDQKARAKSEYVVGQFLRFMECRASVVVFRLNLVDTMYDTRRFLSCGLFLLNSIGVFHPNHVIKLHEWMSLSFSWHEFFRSRYIIRLNRLYWFGPWIYFNVPRYILFDFSMWMFLMIRCPKMEDIVFPICSLDYQRLRNYLRYKRTSGADGMQIELFRGTEYK